MRPGDIFKACVDGLGFTLCLWAAMSLFGEPSFVHHNLTNALVFTGVIYALGSGSARRDARGSER